MTKFKKCINCGWPGLTWQEARRSYVRLIKVGVPQDEAKRRSPTCARCLSASAQSALREASEVTLAEDNYIISIIPWRYSVV